MLLDLFESEGRSFQKTIDVLGAQENKSPITVVAPEFLALHGNKLLEQAKSENLKVHLFFYFHCLVKREKTKNKVFLSFSRFLINFFFPLLAEKHRGG